MLPEGRDAGDRAHLRRSLLVVGLWVPLLAQVLAAFSSALASRLGGDGYAQLAATGFVLLAGFPGFLHGQRADLPPRWIVRYGPVAGLAVLLLATWAADMHLSAGDFTRRGLHPLAWLPFAPWAGLGLAAAFSCAKWMLLGVPALAYAGYAVSLWLGSRKRPARGRWWSGPVAGSLVALAVVAGWQGHLRQQALVPFSVRGDRVHEEVDLSRYRPFARDNLLVPVEAPPGGRFATDHAPRLDGATAAYPVYAAMAQAFYTPEAAAQAVRVSRTSQAYERLIRGDADAIFVAEASPDHQRMARAQGVTLRFTPVAREAFVFLVSEANPVRNLTAVQVRDIYAGRVTRWSELAGEDEAIIAFQRPRNSGSQTVMRARVMQGTAMRKPLEEEVAQGMGGLVRRVATYRNAPQSIGYSFLHYATRMQGSTRLRLLSIDGVAPTRENVRAGSYPYTVDVFMVTTDRSRPGTDRVRDWIQSPQGRKLIEQVGYVAR